MFRIIAAAIILCSFSANAHEWYDKGCCSGQDCAPILEKHRNAAGDWVVTTKMGTATFSAKTLIRPSQDEKDHACMMRPFEPSMTQMLPLCLYFRVEM